MTLHPRSPRSLHDVRPIAEDLMELTRGGGSVVALGFLLGVAGATAAYWGLSGAAGTGSGKVMFIAGGLIFLGMGVLFMLGRLGHVLDRRTGQVVSWWGAAGFRRSRRRPLADFDRVSLEKHVDQADDPPDVFFVVDLSGPGPPLRLLRHRDYGEARRRAEAVAKFLGLGMADSGTGATVFRTAGTLDESFRERVLRSGEAIQWPEVPEGAAIAYRVEGEQAVIELRRGERVIVSSRGLRIERRTLCRTRIWTFPAETLEEFILSSGTDVPLAGLFGLSGGLTVRSDTASHTFATGMTQRERAWLHDAIRYIIVSGSV